MFLQDLTDNKEEYCDNGCFSKNLQKQGYFSFLQAETYAKNCIKECYKENAKKLKRHEKEYEKWKIYTINTKRSKIEP
jgi:hypothetical protein